MSSLLSGPSSITAWIEETAFRAITTTTSGRAAAAAVEPHRPKIVQVLARVTKGVCNECPLYLILHDGQTSALAFLSESATESLPQMATRGSLVRINDWSLSMSRVCARQHYEHLRSADGASTAIRSRPSLFAAPICLYINGNVEILGGEGMGLVGQPTDVNESIQVRRALQSIRYDDGILMQRLQLTDSPQQQQQQQQGTGGVVLGDVMQLFASESAETNMVVDAVVALAEQQQRHPQQPSVGRNGETSNTNHGKPQGSPVLGNLSELFAKSRGDAPAAAAATDTLNTVLAMAADEMRKRQPKGAISPAAQRQSREVTPPVGDLSSREQRDDAEHGVVPVLGDVTRIFERRSSSPGNNEMEAILALANEQRQRQDAAQSSISPHNKDKTQPSNSSPSSRKGGAGGSHTKVLLAPPPDSSNNRTNQTDGEPCEPETERATRSGDEDGSLKRKISTDEYESMRDRNASQDLRVVVGRGINAATRSERVTQESESESDEVVGISAMLASQRDEQEGADLFIEKSTEANITVRSRKRRRIEEVSALPDKRRPVSLPVTVAAQRDVDEAERARRQSRTQRTFSVFAEIMRHAREQSTDVIVFRHPRRQASSAKKRKDTNDFRGWLARNVVR